MSENKSIIEKLSSIFPKKKGEVGVSVIERKRIIEEHLPTLNEILDEIGKLNQLTFSGNLQHITEAKKNVETFRRSRLQPMLDSLGLILNDGMNNGYPGEAVLYSGVLYKEIKPGTGDLEYRNTFVELVRPKISDRWPSADGLVHTYQDGVVKPFEGKSYRVPEKSNK